MNVKARHSIFTREISSPQCNMVQMKVCKENILPKVAKLPLFAGCARDEIKAILEETQGKLRQFDAGEVILHECTPAVSMVVVVSGVVFVREPRPDLVLRRQPFRPALPASGRRTTVRYSRISFRATSLLPRCFLRLLPCYGKLVITIRLTNVWRWQPR